MNTKQIPISVHIITIYKHTKLIKEDRPVIKSIFLCVISENVCNKSGLIPELFC